MTKIGVVDIGSNSMRLIIVEINKNRSFRIIDELKESVRLGMYMSENGNLSEFRIKKLYRLYLILKTYPLLLELNN